MTRLRDRTGDIIGRLTVIGRLPNHIQLNGRQRVMWECICSCGKRTIVDAGNLRTNHSTSCGCLLQDFCSSVGKANFQHGRTKTREWQAWRGAKSRCNNPSAPQYFNYGARGIRVCSEWENSFEQFFNDMGECPPEYSLDRIDVNGNYNPTNCKWSTITEQQRNRRCTPRVEYNGVKTTLVELSEAQNIPYRLVYERIFRQGWSIHKALTIPKRKRHVQTNVSV